MEKRILIGIVIGVLLIGFVSAGLIDYFGRVSGSAEVVAPVFYLGGNHSDGGVYREIYVDELSDDEGIYFWNGHRLVFKTESLGVDSFYKIRLDAKIYIKSNNYGNTVQVRFIKLDENNAEEVICEVAGVRETRERYWAETFSCESSDDIDLSEYDRIAVEFRGNGDEDQEYWIRVGYDKYTHGASRIEVTAI